MEMERKIRRWIEENRDEEYAQFQKKLLPTIDPERIRGVRTPALRNYAKTLAKDKTVLSFLDQLPHELFEENQLHAFIISNIRDYDQCMIQLNRFLPYVDNWSTCDQMSPPVFRRHKAELILQIQKWVESSETYTVRYGIGMLMRYYLDEEFEADYLSVVAGIQSDEYYVKMMVAWYFATALAKQYESALPFLKDRRLPVWVHNKTIQKAVESYRIPAERKELLKKMRIRIDEKGK